MATSDAPLNVPNVTLAVARGASQALSGGNAALGWSATGLADGEEVTLTTDGSEGWDFGAGPTEMATLGFGQGLLSTATIGSLFQNHTDPHSGVLWTLETGGERRIAEEGGIRAIKIVENAWGDASGGFLTWVFGNQIPENGKLFISTLSKSNYGFVNYPYETGVVDTVSATEIVLSQPYTGASATNAPVMSAPDISNESLGKYSFRATFTNGSTIVSVTEGDPDAGGVQPGWLIGKQFGSQWKGVRVSDTGGSGSDLAYPTPNNIYESPNNGTEHGFLPNTTTWKYMKPSNIYNLPGSMWYKQWARSDHQLSYGTLGGTNSKASGNLIVPTENYAVYNQNETTGLTLHDTNRRMGAISWQDYSTGVKNPNLFRADLFAQTNSFARFELANSSSPATTTEAYILPPFLINWSTTSVKLLLWKALMASYSGKFIHFYDDSGIFRKAVSL